MIIAAAVVSHNRPHLLHQVLSALNQQTHTLDKIFVIDNASGIETKQLLEKWNTLANLETIFLTNNIGGAGGFAKAVEKGLELKCDWIWLMDDDAIPALDALEKLYNKLPELGSDAGALCSAVVEFGSIASLHRRYFNPMILKETPIKIDQYSLSSVNIDTASFVGFLLNCKVAKQLGTPDIRYFIAYDDTEYSLRIKKAGWKLWLIPSSVINHKRTIEGRLRNSPYGSKHFYNLRNQLIVFRKYGCSSSWRLLIPISKHLVLAISNFSFSAIQLWWKACKESKNFF